MQEKENISNAFKVRFIKLLSYQELQGNRVSDSAVVSILKSLIQRKKQSYIKKKDHTPYIRQVTQTFYDPANRLFVCD